MTEGTILIANRGEIAVRIIRAARELGLRTLQAHSSADAGSLAVRLADAAVDIGPAPAAKSYLRIDGLIDAARRGGATAVHPGYGFLSENAAFAAAVEAAGLAWIGPSAEAIRRMGDKAAARATAIAAGVPTVPGSDGPLATVGEAAVVAAALGYPVMVKAAAGGGGRGIRIARDPEELLRLWPQAAAEAQAAFGDGALYLEKVIEHARHVEVQVLGDGRRVIHLFERECSLQRRRQKLWEEAPSPVLPDALRDALCASAVALAQSVGYRGAGTVEYLYDEASGRFYFIEMNTRIQVEHPVTEMITGIDLVREQIRIGLGADLGMTQAAVRRHGHALEVRLNAEDPARGFMPRPGRIDHLELPGGPGVRVDTMLFPGYTVPPYYDSLLAKLVVWGEDRGHALARLERALAELRIEGVPTTAGLHRDLAADPEVRAARFHSTWLEGWLAARQPR
ncbi:MAG: acetyl-CoA carboxylase biotin carboxylase subunit [Rhodobacteraceae bacterium]|jgi:acetyl-CoA carboxylase biotin carboxylase subunit|nr:acetyl-CoA carboxylase biotin carboxylase subunit [Paracoccaceae bacterium]